MVVWSNRGCSQKSSSVSELLITNRRSLLARLPSYLSMFLEHLVRQLPFAGGRRTPLLLNVLSAYVIRLIPFIGG
jgi:hypothetical protein